MPLYFFNVYDDAVALDDEGMELPGIAAAHAEAMKGAQSLICEQVIAGRINLRHRIEVEDEDHLPVLVLPFSEVVEISE